MDEEINLFNRFTFLMDQNIRGVQIGVYSVAFVGLAIAVRSVRPFTKFRKPSDIPNSFIKSKIKLKGTVKGIEPSGPYLMIQHKPLVSLFRSNVDNLPVKVSGVKINSLGVNWLQSIVAGNEVTFVPLLKEKQCVHSEVVLPQLIKDKTLRNVNIGPALVQIGFAEVTPIETGMVDDAFYIGYYKKLKSAETMAIRKKDGLWYYVKPAKNVTKLFDVIYMYIKQKLTKSKPKPLAT